MENINFEKPEEITDDIRYEMGRDIENDNATGLPNKARCWITNKSLYIKGKVYKKYDNKYAMEIVDLKIDPATIKKIKYKNGYTKPRRNYYISIGVCIISILLAIITGWQFYMSSEQLLNYHNQQYIITGTDRMGNYTYKNNSNYNSTVTQYENQVSSLNTVFYIIIAFAVIAVIVCIIMTAILLKYKMKYILIKTVQGDLALDINMYTELEINKFKAILKDTKYSNDTNININMINKNDSEQSGSITAEQLEQLKKTMISQGIITKDDFGN